MSRQPLATPDPPTETGEHEGRPYWLWLPRSEPPWPGMVILHGAGSRKENHGDFGRMCAGSGWAAIAFDQRGHGRSDDEMSPGALADVSRMARFLASHEGVDPNRVCVDVSRMARFLASHEGVDPNRVCVRGSSMGGFMALHGAATSDAVAGAIAICPAGEEHMLRGLRDGELEMRMTADSASALDAWLNEHDLRDAVELIGTKPLLLIHAEGDEQIPHEWSRELYERAAEPRKLIQLPGGHHRSAQHDADLQGLALRWMERALG